MFDVLQLDTSSLPEIKLPNIGFEIAPDWPKGFFEIEDLEFPNYNFVLIKIWDAFLNFFDQFPDIVLPAFQSLPDLAEFLKKNMYGKCWLHMDNEN